MVRFNGAIPEWPVPGITDRSVKTECPLLVKADVRSQTSENCLPNDRYAPESSHWADRLLNDR